MPARNERPPRRPARPRWLAWCSLAFLGGLLALRLGVSGDDLAWRSTTEARLRHGDLPTAIWVVEPRDGPPTGNAAILSPEPVIANLDPTLGVRRWTWNHARHVRTVIHAQHETARTEPSGDGAVQFILAPAATYARTGEERRVGGRVERRYEKLPDDQEWFRSRRLED